MTSEFKQFHYSLKIREGHLDTFGHVNNATYFELFEEARWELLNSSGYGLKTIQELGVGPVVLECTIKFLKELLLHQSIRIQSHILSYHKMVGIMLQEIFTEDGTLCCEAKFTFGLFCLKERRLILPPPQWLKAMGGE